MVDIDERVVQMKFDSSDFEKKSKNTLSILDKLHQKLSFKDAASDENVNSIVANVDKIATKSFSIIDRVVDKIHDSIANKIVKFLQENTIGQLQSGWSKFADMTTSVATLKSQGYAMEKITDQLERLNYFTDETSYKFTDMVREIGKFTATGQSLEDATTAMMGIANWAALSGKNANDASRAMYQLSQALGAGQMRLQDYKSVQNLNMDTKEFRQNAIEAAIAVGTLKDNLDGTYTSLVNNKISFSLQNFSESLTQGKWFNTQVMMKTYKKYSEAVDEIRDIYETKTFFDAQGNATRLNTTADAVEEVKRNNEYLIKKFQKTELDSTSITKLLNKWKQVEKVTARTVDEYAEINGLTKEQAKIQMEEQQKNYAEYLKEYAETFKDAEKSAEDALNEWHTYVSEFGVKAFLSAQEAKTFTDAIDSAKDAASTVWTTIYTNVFGNYEEAKEIWTDLANALYEIFVERLWSLNDIFEYWKSGGRSAMEAELKEYENELNRLKKKSMKTTQDAERIQFLQNQVEKLNDEINAIIVDGQRTTTTALQKTLDDYKTELDQLKKKSDPTLADQERIKFIQNELVRLNDQMENTVFANGRTILFQGIYAFGSGLKSIILNFREAWDGLFEENESGKKLLSFSEKFRASMFQFYTMMKELGESDFFANIAQSIRNILSPFKALVQIIKAVIAQFIPDSENTVSILVRISEAIKNITEKLVPTQETINKIARILRGAVAVIKFVGKVAYGLWKSILSPILSAAWELLSSIIDIILDVAAAIGDAFFAFEEGIGPMEALGAVGETLRDILLSIVYVLATIVREITKFVAPVFNVLKNTIGDVINKIKGLVKSDGKGGNVLTNIADGFHDMADRAKKAWHEGETLADVFNRFKGGSGIGNFLQMLGAMLDNLITRIGRTIVAILGLDEELAKSKIGEGIQTAKDIIVQAFAILKWLYTNVIKPVFSLFFEGIKNSLKEVGEAFRSGDINYFLDTLKRLFGTISSMEIVKLIRMLLRVLGSGGLLKIFKNGAQALKGIYKYFSAKATNEMSSALIKMALALTIVVGAMTALTFLPQDKLEKLGGLLLSAAVAMGAMMLGLMGMGVVMKLLDNPLRGITAMFWSMTVAMLTTILAIRGMEKAFGDLWTVTQKGTDAQGNPIYSRRFNWDAMLELAGAALAPVLAVFGVLLGISWVAKKLNAGTALKTFAYSVAGLGIGIAALALGFRTLIQVIRDSKPEEAAAAVKIIIVLLAVLTLAGIALSRFSGTMNGWKSGLGVAIAMAGMMLTISLIVIPCLDDMVKNRDKFPQYLEALSIFAFTMLSISASLWLMTVGTKGGLHILAAGLVFNNMTRVISKMLLPMLQTIQTIDFASALSGVATIGLLVLSLSGAVRLILDGLANIITSVSKINWKSWAAIIISTGLMVALIIGMINLFEMAGIEVSAGSILAPLAIVAGICLTFGIFVKSISKTLGSGDKMRQNVIKVFTSILLMLTVVSAGIIGIIAVSGELFKGNTENALLTIAAYSLSVTLIILALTSQFAKLVSSLSGTIKDISKTEFERVMQVISIMMKFMALIMGGFLLNTIGVGLTYSNPTASLAPILGLFVSLLIFLPTMKAVLLNLFDDILEITKDINEKKLDQIIETLKVMLTSIAAIVGVIGLAVAGVGITYGNGSEWQSIIASIGIVIAVIGSIYAASKAFEIIGKMVKDEAFTDAVFKKFNTVVIIMAGYIALITGVLTIAINSMSDRIGINFANAVIIVGTILVTTLAMSKMFSSLLNNIDSKDFSRNSLIALGLSLATMIAITYEVSGFFQKIHDYEVLDWTTGLSFAIAMGGYLIALGYAMQMILRAVNVMPMNAQAANVVALSMLGMIGVVGMSALLVNSLSNLAGVDWTTALAALGGIAIIMLTLSRIIDTLVMTSAMPMNITNILGGVAVMFGALASISLFAPSIFSAFKQLEGVSWGTVAQGLLVVLGPFLLIFEVIKSMSFGGLGDAFVVTAIKIALGIGAITLALRALTQVGFLIKELFGLGSGAGRAFQEGFEKEEGIKSPSKEFAKDGKYIVQGLAQGIKKNQKIVGNSASKLGDYTNDSFCDSLGIASPSKVFYENGRFVVRGFINGINDESNKNKQAGADMASGFGEGMDDAMEGFKDKWAGLWSDLGMDTDIANAMKEGTKDLPGILEESIFGPTVDALTEDEEKELKRLEEEYARIGGNMSEVDAKRLVELQGKKAKAGKNKLQGDLMETVTGAVSGALGSNDVISSVTGGLSNLKDKALGWLGESKVGQAVAGIFTGDEGVVDNLEDNLLGENGAISKTIKKITEDGGILEAAKDLGTKLGGAISDALGNAFSFDYGSGSVFDKAMSALTGEGNRQRNEKNFQDWYDRYSEELGLGYNTDKGFSFYHKVMSSIREFGNEGVLDISRFQEYADGFNELGDAWSTIKNLHIDDGLFWIGEGTGAWKIDKEKEEEYERNEAKKKVLKNQFAHVLGYDDYDSMAEEDRKKLDKYFYTILKEATQKGFINENGAFIKEGHSKGELTMFAEYLRTGGYLVSYEDDLKEMDDQVSKLLTAQGFAKEDFNEEQLNAIRDWALANGYLDNNTQLIKDAVLDDQTKIDIIIGYLSSIANGGLIEGDNRDVYQKAQEYAKKYNSATDTATRAYYATEKSRIAEDVKKDYDTTVAFMRTTNYGMLSDEQKKFYQQKKAFYEEYYGLGEARVQGLVDGETKTYQKYGPNAMTNMTQNDQEIVKKEDKTNSPSEVYYDFGMFRAIGLYNGFTDGMKMFSKLSLDEIQDLNDDSKLALTAMVNSLDDETIQPTIAPIYDDSVFNNGISGINGSFTGLNNNANTTVKSFNNKTQDYTDSLDLLNSKIDTLNGIVNTFMHLVDDNAEERNINITVEPDASNIFDLVVNENRVRKQRLGYSNLV